MAAIQLAEASGELTEFSGDEVHHGANPPDLAGVAMESQPQLAARDGRRRPDRTKLGIGRGQASWQANQPRAGGGCRGLTIAAVAAESNMCERQIATQPFRLRNAFGERRVHRDERSVGATAREIGRSLYLEIRSSSIKLERNAADLPLHQSVLLEAPEAQGDIYLPPREAQGLGVSNQLDGDGRMRRAELRQQRREDPCPEPFGRGHGTRSGQSSAA